LNTKVTPGEIVVMAAGGVGIIASFLPFADPEFGDSVNAWDGDVFGLFPVATLIGIYVLVAGGLVALTKFANVQIGNVFGFGLVQLVLVLGFFAAIQAIAYLLTEFSGIDRGIGYWLLLLSAIASVVGGVLMTNERRAAGPGVGPPRGPGSV
jgi:hypothetical protein